MGAVGVGGTSSKKNPVSDDWPNDSDRGSENSNGGAGVDSGAGDNDNDGASVGYGGLADSDIPAVHYLMRFAYVPHHQMVTSENFPSALKEFQVLTNMRATYLLRC